MKETEKILLINSLGIGYMPGKVTMALLPPLFASANVGEMIAVIGRNGIGKSTLLKTIAGLLPAVNGSVIIRGKKIEEYSRSEIAGSLGYICTEPVKISNMTVYDLVATGRFQHTNWIGSIDSVSNEIINYSIETAGISNLKLRYITELSDGERQRALIAMVLAQDTNIIIMDEPTAFLDVSGRFEIIHLLKKMAGSGKTIIFSTHDFNIALNQSDKVWLLLENGLIEGAPEDLIMNGSIGKLFDKTQYKFNPADGSFEIISGEKFKIYLEGNSPLRFWAEKALIRSGYGVSKIKTEPYLSFSESKDVSGFILNTENNQMHFSTIYELINHLRSCQIHCL